MKKQIFLGILISLMFIPTASLKAQSTQGTDFWVTLMSGDRGKDGTGKGFDTLSLTFAAKESTWVWIENEYENFKDSVQVGNDTIYRYKLNGKKADNTTYDYSHTCLVNDDDNEVVSNRALHITSEKGKPISLIAANYKVKSFDVAAILPTPSLMSEYRIQTYPPSAHEDNSQGSHFAIVAAEDNVIVDITPTVYTKSKRHKPGETFTTDTLMKGQVYYVWTGEGTGDSYDFSGTAVKARNNKKIAVFNGNRHTNIPSKIRDRDHVYSQAMPINYWGKRFAITSSLTTIDNQKSGSDYKKLDGYWERVDKIRVQALVDGTVVKIDGKPVHTFEFENGSANDRKHFYEFDFGSTKDAMAGYTEKAGMPFFEGASHYVETSCPSAVHLIMTSNQYDHTKKKVDGTEYKYCNGDPSLIWVNPIEQKIDTLTFGTFQTDQVKDHFINIVTQKENVKSVILDGDSIYDQFSELAGNPKYVFARITGVEDRAHTLTADSGFIAHVYGFGLRESYGYPAGGRTMDLTAFITINGVVYKPGEENQICGDDKVDFGCELNYEYDSIYWHFGDGQDTITKNVDAVEHYYGKADAYKAYVLIYRHLGDDDGCLDFGAKDSIAFLVNIGNYKIDLKDIKLPYCSKEGDEVDLTITLDNPSGVSLKSDSVKLTFNAASRTAGFKESEIRFQGDTVMIIRVPSGAKNQTTYGMHIHIGSECPNSVLDKDLSFTLTFDIPVLAQRYNNVLGVLRDSFPTQELTDFVWFHDGDTVPDQETSVLYLDEKDPKNSGEYYVCFIIKEKGKADIPYCTCPIHFTANSKQHEFEANPDSLIVTATYIAAKGGKVFVNIDYNGETNINCYAEWYDVSGRAVAGGRYENLPDGGCTIDAPSTAGLYLLRVVTGKGARSFKFIVNN